MIQRRNIGIHCFFLHQTCCCFICDKAKAASDTAKAESDETAKAGSEDAAKEGRHSNDRTAVPHELNALCMGVLF